MSETTLDITASKTGKYSLLFSGWQKTFGGWTVLLMTVLTVFFIIYQLFKMGNEKQVALIADVLQAVIGLAVATLAWRVTRHSAIDDDSRRAWRIMTASFVVYAFGHLLWFYYSSILGIEPFPSLADVGFWLFYPLMMWALLSFPTAKTTSSERLKFVMDVAIVLLAGTIAVWNFIIRPTIEVSKEGDLLMTGLNLSYVVGDLVLLLGIATVLLRAPLRINRIALLTVVFGLMNTAVADIGFAFFTLKGTYSSGHWVDNFFVTGLLTFLIACHFQHQNLSQIKAEGEEEIQENDVQNFGWLPYLAIAVGCGMLLYESRAFWGEPLGIIVFATLGITTLVVLRQIAAVKENVRLLGEQTKRESELHFRTLVENSSDLISILDLKGFFTYQSPSFEKILGYENDELIGRHSLEFAHQDEMEGIKKDYRELISDPQKMFTREYRFRHKNGSWRILESITKTLKDDEGELLGILFNLRDVTERRESEDKMRAFTSKLERSNRELQDFAYVASHDLQEPLRKVQAFGDRLERKYAPSLEDEARDYIKRMRDASSRMQILINDLLTFSRITTKAQPFVSVSLKQVAEEVVSDLEIRIEQTKAKIEIGDLPEIQADAVQMRQLLQNLIGNALKFNRPDETPIIKIYSENIVVSLNPSDDEDIHTTKTTNDFCKICVEDNGIGFEEKYLDRIFTVFQRLHGRSEYEGSGVGLAVCRKIAERHEGTITAESTPGKGSKFIVVLPTKQTQGEFNLNE